MVVDLITGLAKFAFMLWEIAYSTWRGKSVYTFERTLGTMGCEVLRLLMALVLVPLFVGAYLHLFRHASLFSLSAGAASTWVLAIFVFSFVDYWSHRLSHAVPLLWAIHSVHHQLEELNAVAGGRVSFLNDLVTLSLLFVLAILGIPLSVTLSVVGVFAFYSVVLHCPLFGSFGWLGHVVASPAFHRLHHGTQPQYLNKNFSISLAFWDRVFGTYVEETVPPKYGLANGFASNSPFRANWQPWVDYFSGARKTYAPLAVRKLSLSQRAYLIVQMVLVLLCASFLQNKTGPALAVGTAILVLATVLGSLASLDGLLRSSRGALPAEAFRVGLWMPAVFLLTRHAEWSGSSFGWATGAAVVFTIWLRVAFAPGKKAPVAEAKPRRSDAA